jgi:hypothetical protein
LKEAAINYILAEVKVSFMLVTERNDQLKRFYLFTDEDLKANQNGELSASQMIGLEEDMQMVKRYLPGIIALILLLFGGMFIYVLVPAKNWFSVSSLWSAIWPLLLFVAICCLPLFYYMNVLRQGRVKMISGIAVVKMYVNAPPYTMKRYYVQILNKKFGLLSKEGNFVTGTKYTVYYINKFGVLSVLSACAES